MENPGSSRRFVGAPKSEGADQAAFPEGGDARGGGPGRSATGPSPGLMGFPPRSILLVMLSAVGDAVQVLPVASALRRAFPETHISWILQPGPHSLVQGHPAIDEFIVLQRGKGIGYQAPAEAPAPASSPAPSPGGPPGSAGRGGIASGIRGIAAGARSLRSAAARMPGGRFDLLLDLQVYLKAGLLTAITPARVRLGFDRARARDLNWLFTTHKIPPHPNRFAHIQDQYFEFLRYLGVDPEPVHYGLELTDEERTQQRVFFSSLDRPPCALVLATSDPRKNWDPTGYAEVASRLISEFGMQPILVGGTSDAEEKAARIILQGTDGGIMDARGGGLRRLLWLLDGSELVISPDTGPLHMARAMEVPVIGLFGFTNPKRSGPYRLSRELIVDGYALGPGEEYPVSMERRRGRMGRITPEKVVEKVALARGRARTRKEG